LGSILVIGCDQVCSVIFSPLGSVDQVLDVGDW
jgi:hypothetical protein